MNCSDQLSRNCRALRLAGELAVRKSEVGLNVLQARSALPLAVDNRLKILPPTYLDLDPWPARGAFLCLRVVLGDLQRSVTLGPAEAEIGLFVLVKRGVAYEPVEEAVCQSPSCSFLLGLVIGLLRG